MRRHDQKSARLGRIAPDRPRPVVEFVERTAAALEIGRPLRRQRDRSRRAAKKRDTERLLHARHPAARGGRRDAERAGRPGKARPLGDCGEGAQLVYSIQQIIPISALLKRQSSQLSSLTQECIFVVGEQYGSRRVSKRRER
jgi:hypothetical protein